jgi:hypothetical protein
VTGNSAAAVGDALGEADGAGVIDAVGATLGAVGASVNPGELAVPEQAARMRVRAATRAAPRA